MKAYRPLALVAALAAVLGGGLLVSGLRPSPPRARDTALLGDVAQTGAALRTGDLVLSETHGTETQLVRLRAGDPADRTPLLRIPHAAGWAPRVSLAPGGRLVAYTALAEGARSPDTEATLWMVDLGARRTRRLAQGVDLRTTPVWSADGTRLVVLRAETGAGLRLTLEEVEVQTGTMRTIARAEGPTRLLPAAYAPAGDRFYLVRFGREGAVLEELHRDDGAVRRIARVAAGAARAFELAPGGQALAFLAQDEASKRYRATVVDLRTGDIRPLLTGVTRLEDVGVAWTPGPQPSVTVGVVGGEGRPNGLVTDGTGSSVGGAGTSGFDVPVAWSPDGRLLVVRAFSGASADAPGREDPMLVDREGGRRPLAAGTPVEVVGWVRHGP